MSLAYENQKVGHARISRHSGRKASPGEMGRTVVSNVFFSGSFFVVYKSRTSSTAGRVRFLCPTLLFSAFTLWRGRWWRSSLLLASEERIDITGHVCLLKSIGLESVVQNCSYLPLLKCRGYPALVRGHTSSFLFSLSQIRMLPHSFLVFMSSQTRHGYVVRPSSPASRPLHPCP